jgi:F-type H+-transporting ATPase subunit b
VRAFFAERRHRIQGELKAAEDLRAEVEARYAEWQRKLAELDAELEQLRGRARERAEAERERILAEAGVAAERIRREAQSAIEQELRRSRIQLREEAADLAVELAGSLLRTQVTEADRERLLDEFIERVEQSGQAASRSGGDRDPTSGGNGGGRTA